MQKEVTVMKEEVSTHRSLETGVTAGPKGRHGEAPGLVRGQREQGGSLGDGLYGDFYGQQWARQGQQGRQV